MWSQKFMETRARGWRKKVCFICLHQIAFERFLLINATWECPPLRIKGIKENICIKSVLAGMRTPVSQTGKCSLIMQK